MRVFLHALLAAWVLAAPAARADEAAVRSASQALVEAWNRHDVPAWSAQLAQDPWVTDVDDSYYERFKGREAALGRFAHYVEGSDLEWQIVRMKTRPDGVVSVVLVQRISMLPKTDGKYQHVITNDPALARWRRDADGRWRLAFFTSHRGWALAEIKKDEDGVPVAAAGASTPSTPASAPPRAVPRGTTGSEPAEYTAFWGRAAQGCNYCHGRPPPLPSSAIASRIVSAGAATDSGAELRAAMARQEGGAMRYVLADPALTDEALEAVRRYLVDVRDGALAQQLDFDAPGATRELRLRNERASGDTPVRIAALRVTGPFRLDAARSECRVGRRIAGQSSCRLVLRAGARATPAEAGAVELRLAPTPGLEPRTRRTRLQITAAARPIAAVERR